MPEIGWKERVLALTKLKDNLMELMPGGKENTTKGPDRILRRSLSTSKIESIRSTLSHGGESPRENVSTPCSPKHVKVQRLRTVHRSASLPLKPALRRMNSMSSSDSFDSSSSSPESTLRKHVTFSKYALLLAAASDNSVKELEDLLEKDPAYINKPSSSGQTPLHKAAIKGNTECVELLISRGADMNCADKQGRTPMLLAWNHKHSECFQIMLDASRKKENSSLKSAYL